MAADRSDPRPNALAAADVLSREVRLLLDGLLAAAPFLRDWPETAPSRSPEPRPQPVLAWLDELLPLGTPTTAPLVEALTERARDLAWRQSYAPADFGQAFLDRYAWTELFGLSGPLASATVACGFLLLGPDTLYPAHAHAAEELYVPLAGAALWSRGGEGWVSRAPGEPIHHPSWVPHAMRTGAEPLLALYLWRGGDLAAKPVIVGGA